MLPDTDYRYTPFELAVRDGLRASRRISGYAVRYGVPSDLGPFVEEISPRAFEGTLNNAQDNVRLYVQHNRDRLLATRQAGTLRLSSDATGLRFEADLPETATADEVLALIERGDYSGVSVGFVIPSARYTWAVRAGRRVGTLVSANLFEISIVDNPAHRNTSVAIRAAFEAYEAEQRKGLLPIEIAERLYLRR